jgi:hypothetical protein
MRQPEAAGLLTRRAQADQFLLDTIVEKPASGKVLELLAALQITHCQPFPEPAQWLSTQDYPVHVLGLQLRHCDEQA